MFMILSLIATATVAAPVDPSEEAEMLKKHMDQEVEAVQEIVIDDSVVDEFGFDLEEEES